MTNSEKQMLHAVIDVCKKYNLSPQQGVSALANVLANMLYAVGIQTGQSDPNKFAKDMIRQMLDQM